MLRSFRLANHKSVRDEQELLLMPAYDKLRPVVPVAAIFGANASGKSNLLDGLRWLQSAVRESYARWEPGAGVPRTPFRLDPIFATKPSLYCVELIVDGLRYSYGVEVDFLHVVEEWLYAYPHGRRRLVFERVGGNVRLGSTMPDYRTRGGQLARQTRDNALLLSVAAHNDVVEVQPIYRWFRSGLTFGDDGDAVQEDLIHRMRDERQREVLVGLVRAADLGIADIRVDDDGYSRFDVEYLKVLPDEVIDVAARRVAEDQVGRSSPGPQVAFHHGFGGATLTFKEQSAGTRSWVALIGRALRTLEVGGLLVVDEVDASLHPHLTARLINLFRDAETNHRGGQLMFTSHDAFLLDEDTLARDEIWFVEKEPDVGSSRLFPLTDFHPRKNENTAGRYLAGSYGAVPVVVDEDFRAAVRRVRGSDAAA